MAIISVGCSDQLHVSMHFTFSHVSSSIHLNQSGLCSYWIATSWLKFYYRILEIMLLLWKVVIDARFWFHHKLFSWVFVWITTRTNMSIPNVYCIQVSIPSTYLCLRVQSSPPFKGVDVWRSGILFWSCLTDPCHPSRLSLPSFWRHLQSSVHFNVYKPEPAFHLATVSRIDWRSALSDKVEPLVSVIRSPR